MTEEQAEIMFNSLLKIIGENKINHKVEEIDVVDSEMDEISKRLLLELESASSKDLSDATYAKMILRCSDIHYTKRILQKHFLSIKHSDSSECDREKIAVIKVLLYTTWLQRLYFIIRSFLMGQIGGIVTLVAIWVVGSIDVVGMLILGMFVFVFSLVVTRLFDAQITQATKKIVAVMSRRRKVRDFIMNHF